MDMQEPQIRLVLPTGRLSETVVALLADAGLTMRCNGKDYRPTASDARFRVKRLKAANIPKLIEYQAHDIGFCGLDWIQESHAEVEMLIDTKLLPVRVVVAGPEEPNPFVTHSGRPLIIASEYESLTKRYMTFHDLEYQFVRTYGATEVYPPEDADLIVDNVATGRTLADNGLRIIDEILTSTTVLVASPAALNDPFKRSVIDELVLLIHSVLNARQRVLLDMNVESTQLDGVIRLLPAMRAPTVQQLHGDRGYAVRTAVLRSDINRLLPVLKEAGATDILQSPIQRVVI